MRQRVTAVMVLALLGAAGCGGGSTPATSTATRVAPAATAAGATAAADPAPAPRCHKIPRTTVRLIASHGNPKTRFDVSAAAAVRVRSGYAVSLPAIAGGTRRMATWFVDRLLAPETVTSGNVQALQITNWPLDSPGAEPVRQSQICAAKNLRAAAPVAP